MKSWIFIIIFFIISNLLGTIINIPADQPTIQAGINVSVDGDTILVQPGTYNENINYNGNNITVASLFLTTQDTSYISQTIIDGNQNGSVVRFESGENYTTVLIGFSLTGCSGKHFIFEEEPGIYYDHYRGGAIYCENSNPEIDYINIYNNVANEGGGIYCINSNSNINNTKIFSNIASWGEYFYCDGGGFYCSSSNLVIANIELYNNSTDGSGGGFYSRNNSNLSISNSEIKNNTSTGSSGGIYLDMNSEALFDNVEIKDNQSKTGWGGGITIRHESNLFIKNSLIADNIAFRGGGIAVGENGSINFSNVFKNNIYNNHASIGSDIYSYIPTFVIVDTFTVLEPTAYHSVCETGGSIIFNIQNSLFEQVDADLYISPQGDNTNSGLSWDEPLKNISHATSIIIAEESNPHTIHLDQGTYSFQSTNEIFPIVCLSNISLIGMNQLNTILDAESQNNVLFLKNVENSYIANLQLINGISIISYNSGGGIHIEASETDLSDMIISNNHSFVGGGINILGSDVDLSDMIISNNSSYEGGGLKCMESILNLNRVQITDNSSTFRGGTMMLNHSISNIVNSTFSNNSGGSSTLGGIDAFYSTLLGLNFIYWNNQPNVIHQGYNSEVNIFYSNIEDGWEGTGNINSDPLFELPNYTLQESSPCIDSGIAYFEFGGEIILDLSPDEYTGYAPDMGKYEYGMNGIEDNTMYSPSYSYLHQNYPNPFNPTTNISFSIPEESNVELSIYNAKGQKVKSIADESYESGSHLVKWDGRDDSNKPVSSGIYLYKLKVNGKIEAVKKCLLLK